jgi:hypothetical protein
MKMSGGPASINIKIILLLSAALIAAGTLYYTQYLVEKLQENESQIVEFYARGIEYVANSTSPDADITFLFENIIKPIDFPLIITDRDDNINMDDPSGRKNVEIDSTLSRGEQMKFLREKIKEMDAIHEPLSVIYADTIVLQKIHYGESKIISQLRFYPYAQITIAALFIIIGYIGFSSIKRSEQGNIWVGMAKETAHQFGTPISSLMGWLEMLKLSYKDPDKVLDVADEIENDVEKLNKITYRFSKIGATPEIKEKNVFDEIKKVTEYFQRRLPQTGKTVELTINGDDKVTAGINSELFGWVIENLVKNALDAIEGKSGEIRIHVKDCHSRVEVEVKDTGKGIDMRRRKDVFRPGYSTKRRGWGLGLSLSKRIIEVYHKGKIFVKSSAPGEGTVFKIVLKKT